MAMMDKINLLNTPSGEKWKRIGAGRRAGILVPLFSVYSKKSVGIGDFSDLKLLIDLCDKMGVSILQLLPMNEVSGTSCPYDAISSFAIEPVYISLADMNASKKGQIKSKINGIKKRFPAGKDYVDYRIKEEKVGLLWDIYVKEGADASEFKKFLDENGYWIDDFALFKILKDYHGGRPWYEWEESYKNREGGALNYFRKEHHKKILFQKWMQWIAFGQFSAAKACAKRKKVLIKGDLPILISRDSADVWAHPQFFKLGFAAGAPPDMYCARGQRWGMPTYEWENIASDDYRYLKEKLRFAENFYDILRVDHVVGLFRIWSIPYNDPLENEGLNGAFDPADENMWKERGQKILSAMLENTKMLLLGEDLGVIPNACPETLKEFGMPGNDVQRWVKDWKTKHDFLEPKDYRFISVAMLSTHDTTNWAAWWENEAGTIDEALFIRKARERGIDYEGVKSRLFDPNRSRHGRLRWLDSVASSKVFSDILGRPGEEVADFIDIYENTYHEKEKLWRHLRIKGPMREECDPEVMRAALGITLGSRAIFCIELLIDYLYLTGIFKGDPYRYRINRPGTIRKENWSLIVPKRLEDILEDRVCKETKLMISSAERI